MREEILYIGTFRLPDRNAGAIRVRGIADALTEAGYAVNLIGDDSFRADREPSEGSDLSRLSFAIRRGIDLLITSESFLARIREVDWSRVAAVIFYPGSASLLWHLLKLCRRYRVPLIVDSGEWFNPSHMPGGRYGPFALDSELRMRWLHLRARNMICDSSYLQRYYSGKGCNAIRVHTPIGKDVIRGFPLSPRNPETPTRQLSLVYAGSPGRKELFAQIAVGMQAARRQGIDVIFRVVGVTKSEFSEIAGIEAGRLPDLDGIECYGRVPRATALSIVASSDFTVIIRPDERFAHAGFPSKLVESLGLGVPVIANATSDIAEVIRDEREGYLLSRPTADALEEAIARAAQLGTEERAAMRERALKRAYECFDYRRCVQKLSEFISCAEPCC